MTTPRITLSTTLVLSFLLSPALAQKREVRWLADYDKAIAEARKRNKDVLVDFTGSDWCGWCQKLDEEVFSQKDFMVSLQKQFVLLRLDYPHGDAARRQVPNEKRNAEVADEYDVHSYPTLMLMTPKGEPYGHFSGFLEGGPRVYQQRFAEFTSKGRKALAECTALEDRLAKAKDAAREPILAEALARLKTMQRETPGARALVRIAHQVFEIDPDNQKGLLHDFIKASLDTDTADAKLIDLVHQYDPTTEKGIYQLVAMAMLNRRMTAAQLLACADESDRLIAAGLKDKETLWMLSLNLALWLEEFTEDKVRARKYAKMALDFGAVGDQKAKLEKVLGG